MAKANVTRRAAKREPIQQHLALFPKMSPETLLMLVEAVFAPKSRKRFWIAQHLYATPDLSDRIIAGLVHAGRKLVLTVRSEMEAQNVIPRGKTRGWIDRRAARRAAEGVVS
jgi:hypothetical protein